MKFSQFLEHKRVLTTSLEQLSKYMGMNTLMESEQDFRKEFFQLLNERATDFTYSKGMLDKLREADLEVGLQITNLASGNWPSDDSRVFYRYDGTNYEELENKELEIRENKTDKAWTAVIMTAFSSIDGSYIGPVRDTYNKIKKWGVSKFQAGKLGGTVANIAFKESVAESEDGEGWCGWSHRARVCFKIGDKIFEEGFGDDKTLFSQHGTKTIKTLEDAKLSASKFAEYVS